MIYKLFNNKKKKINKLKVMSLHKKLEKYQKKIKQNKILKK